MITSLEREFFLGFIKIHILYHASQQEIYGADIARELQRHGYTISSGTLYPTLHLLEEKGYLEGNFMVVAGRVRKYYRATQAGKQVLQQSKEKIRELVEEVME